MGEKKSCSTVISEFRHKTLDTLCSVKLSHCMSVFNFLFLIGHDDHKDGLGDFFFFFSKKEKVKRL